MLLLCLLLHYNYYWIITGQMLVTKQQTLSVKTNTVQTDAS